MSNKEVNEMTPYNRLLLKSVIDKMTWVLWKSQRFYDPPFKAYLKRGAFPVASSGLNMLPSPTLAIARLPQYWLDVLRSLPRLGVCSLGSMSRGQPSIRKKWWKRTRWVVSPLSVSEGQRFSGWGITVQWGEGMKSCHQFVYAGSMLSTAHKPLASSPSY